ncbi:MAG TPA: AmmeMemoRadiSam system protein A [Bacteroidaceae bacterium]|nr:AmmeMemoRadiSam system protein A [Bacteroidaceae bacterium]
MIFSKTDKRKLIQLATCAVENYILNGDYQVDVSSNYSKNLQKKCGVFVSAYVKDNLRGCIGTFEEDEPLYKTVQRMAIAAVSRDSRFERVNASELKQLKLEISILTPRKPIHDASEIEIGKHGIFISRGANRGTFLPQVAVNQHWSAEEFLSNCSRYKAGIEWDGWKSADKYVYEAIVIKSSDFKEFKD